MRQWQRVVGKTSGQYRLNVVLFHLHEAKLKMIPTFERLEDKVVLTTPTLVGVGVTVYSPTLPGDMFDPLKVPIEIRETSPSEAAVNEIKAKIAEEQRKLDEINRRLSRPWYEDILINLDEIMREMMDARIPVMHP
jgi:hypothetical protein